MSLLNLTPDTQIVFFQRGPRREDCFFAVREFDSKVIRIATERGSSFSAFCPNIVARVFQ